MTAQYVVLATLALLAVVSTVLFIIQLRKHLNERVDPPSLFKDPHE